MPAWQLSHPYTPLHTFLAAAAQCSTDTHRRHTHKMHSGICTMHFPLGLLLNDKIKKKRVSV